MANSNILAAISPVIISLLLTTCLSVGAALFGILMRGMLHFEPADGVMLHDTWRWLRSGSFADIISTPVFLGLLPLVYYYLACIPYFFLDVLALPALRPYKIRGAKRPATDLAQWMHALLYTLRTVATFVVPGMLFQYLAQGPWLYGHPGMPLCLLHCDGAELLPDRAPSLVELLLHMATCLVGFDLTFFCWHIVHHRNRLLYRHIHSVHHTYHAPFAFTTQYVHPCELFAVTMFSMVIPVTLGCHPLVHWAWLVLSVQLSLDTHTGYDFPLTLDKLVPFGAGPTHHDRHHERPLSNFQPFLTWADQLCGTLYR